VLQQRIAEAQFVVLSANAVRATTGAPVADPYALREYDGHTVAIVGLTGGQGTDEITVRDPVAVASKVVAEVVSRADVVIILSHAGPSLDQQIAEVVPGIDLIVSGGKFGQITMPQSSESTPAPRGSGDAETLVFHADEASPGHAGRRIGVARLVFDDQGRIVEHDWQRLRLGPEIESDPVIAEWITTHREP
jgi:2',3'-cyclic-nucleotide 2'-phosphodiesterase (5'-nucleotidase family)